MAPENGDVFVKSLANFVRTHEKALANALQTRRRYSHDGNISGTPKSPASTSGSFLPSATSIGISGLATALSLGTLTLNYDVKPAKLTLTPHHLFYLLSRFEDLGIDVGPMNVRLENIHAETTPSNYVSFLNSPPNRKTHVRQGANDSDSIHSVSSMRSVMTNMSSLWSSMGFDSAARMEKAKILLEADTKYLYSAFTKIPCLRLSQDRRPRLIKGYEEFPFDTAVPMSVFKNVSALEMYDIDFRTMYGWDSMSEHLQSLTIKRGNIEDVTDLIISVVIDDIERRRRRSSKPQTPSTHFWTSNSTSRSDEVYLGSSIGSFGNSSYSPRRSVSYLTGEADSFAQKQHHEAFTRQTDSSPTRRTHRRSKTMHEMRRSGSGSSDSSARSVNKSSRNRSSTLLQIDCLPPNKWKFLRHLSLADNGLTYLSATGLQPLADSLISLDISSNMFTVPPEELVALPNMKALNLSHCMISSTETFKTATKLAVESLSLRGNRLRSLMGLGSLQSLARVDLRDNLLTDPAELNRLAENPQVREVFVAGNPFTKSYPNFRVQIFNIFRDSGNRTADIKIDGSGPSHSERKQLKDRVIVEAASILREQLLPGSGDVEQSHVLFQGGPEPLLSDDHDTLILSRPHAKPSKRRQSQKRLVDLTLDPAQASTITSALSGERKAQTPTLRLTTTKAHVNNSIVESGTSGDFTNPRVVQPVSPFSALEKENGVAVPGGRHGEESGEPNPWRKRLDVENTRQPLDKQHDGIRTPVAVVQQGALRPMHLAHATLGRQDITVGPSFV